METDKIIEAMADLFKHHHRNACYPDAEDFEARSFATAAYAAMREAMVPVGWQTMDTAPQGERILMKMKHGIIEGVWDGDTGSGYYWRDMEWWPHAWMPIPETPLYALPEIKP